MSLEIIAVFALTVVVFALFISELFAIELVAIGAMVALIASGILTPEEGLAGFGNSATVVVGTMFVFAAALERSGAIEPVARRFTAVLQAAPRVGVVGMIVGVAVLSAFVSNTPVVAGLLPVVVAAARAASISPARLLIPLSFASILGGTCTLLGTSTTLVVNDVAQGLGQASIGMFEMLPMGLVFLGVGTVYLTTIGAWLLPDHRVPDPAPIDFEFVTELQVVPHGPLDRLRLQDVPELTERSDALTLFRRDQRPIPIQSWTRLRAHDVIRVVAPRSRLEALISLPGLTPLAPAPDAPPEHVVEVVIPPGSPLVDRSLKALRFGRTFDAHLLGLRPRPQLTPLRLHKTALQPGDALLLGVSAAGLRSLADQHGIIVTSERIAGPRRRPWWVVGILAAAVALGSSGAVALSAAFLGGALALMLSGCLSKEEAYKAVEWPVVFLLGAIMSLGVAMQKTGAADLIAQWVVDGPGQLGPVFVLAMLYLLTSILTEFMSNVGTAVVMTPVAVASAAGLGVDPRPLVMAVVFGASASFMTPVGYQTNLLVYGAGRYSFRDFMRVGVPLNLIFLALATVCIPWFWSW